MQSALRLAASSISAMPRRQIPIPAGPFPSQGLLPKDETQAASFLKKFPDYDGRGIRVAVLDTGVDPAAFGLNGKGKIVDIIDCTGSGDIPLKTVDATKNSDATTSKDKADAIQLPGISGRTLLVSSSWANPTNKWKVGFKRAYDLWPGDLVKRRKLERKAAWDVKVSTLLSAAKKELDEHEKAVKEAAKQDKPEKSEKADQKAPSDKKATEPTKDDKEKEDKELEQKAKKLDLEAKVSYLNDFSLDDPGPILDVVVFHDGKDWRAVVGGAEGENEQNIAKDEKDQPATLDLRQHRPMTDFRKEKHYERFGTQDLMSYSVNIVDDGEILSLSVVSGTHGTHVAAIIGGHIEDNPELSGVAPGVEIVSLQIGDTRVSALETGQALMRATKAILDTECDICNMSFGEDAAWATEDRGQFISMLRDEVIKKRNVLFVAAAGNAGPALSTIGAPATTSGIISVGAYETPSMQNAEYALLENVPAGPYTWSSRGPTYDGALFTVYAPGGAITGVPQYALQRSQLMNGTSMASPNACGAISMVLSALKAEGIAYTPARVIKGIVATAKDVNGSPNVGLIQVEALHKYLVDSKDQAVLDADFDISIQRQGRPAPDFTKPLGQREGMRGVYLRQPEETSKVFDAICYVKPSFSSFAETEKMYGLDLKLGLASTDSWVRTPAYLSLASSGRNFSIRVDPTSLAPGLHYAEIRAYNLADPGREIFSIPITVCKPEIIASPSHNFKDWHSSAGFMARRYLAVPPAATWAELRLTTNGHASPVNLWIHCVQLQPEVRLSKSEDQFILSCTSGEAVSKPIKVVGGVTMEIVAAQFWNSLPESDVSMEIHFHGITLDTGNSLAVIGGAALPRLQVSSGIRLEEFSPAVSFDRVSSIIRPSDSAITPLGERDIMPDGKRLFQLVNTYPIKLSEKLKVTPSWPIMDNLYDSAFSVLTTVKDPRGRVVKFASLYGSEVEMEKGEYTVSLQMQNSEFKVLEGLKSMPMTLTSKLPEKAAKLSLTVHRDHIDAVTGAGSDAFKNAKLPFGDKRALVLNTSLDGDAAALYKVAKAGDTLFGKLRLGTASSKAEVALSYVLPAQAKEDSDEEKDEDTPLLVDLQLTIVDKIKDESEKTKFLDNLLKDKSNHIPLLVARLEALKDEASAKDVNTAADAILAQIDEAKLAEYYGKKALATHEQKKQDKRLKKDMDTKKSAWTLAHARKLKASLKSDEGRGPQDALFTKYRQFIESPDKNEEFIRISAKRDMERQHYGSAIKALSKLIKEGVSKDKYKEATDLHKQCLQKLNWAALIEYDQRWQLAKEPPITFGW